MGSAAVFVLLVALVSRQTAVVALPFLYCFCVTSSPCFFRFLSSLHSHSTSPRFKLPFPFSFKKPPLFSFKESLLLRQKGRGLLLRVGSRGYRVSSPTGVAFQGTPALFSSHGVLGFGSSMRGRERETVSLKQH